MDLLEIILNVFVSIPGLTAGVLFITAWIKKRVKSNDTITIVISGLVSLALSAVGFFLKLGMFAEVEWWYILIYGLSAMLMANGLSTWELIKKLLIAFKLRVPNYLKL